MPASRVISCAACEACTSVQVAEVSMLRPPLPLRPVPRGADGRPRNEVGHAHGLRLLLHRTGACACISRLYCRMCYRLCASMSSCAAAIASGAPATTIARPPADTVHCHAHAPSKSHANARLHVPLIHRGGCPHHSARGLLICMQCSAQVLLSAWCKCRPGMQALGERCRVCEKKLARSTATQAGRPTRFWEGGKGCRDPKRMDRHDPRRCAVSHFLHSCCLRVVPMQQFICW